MAEINATIPKKNEGMAMAGIKAVIATKIKYTARKIRPRLEIGFMTKSFLIKRTLSINQCALILKRKFSIILCPLSVSTDSG